MSGLDGLWSTIDGLIRSERKPRQPVRIPDDHVESATSPQPAPSGSADAFVPQKDYVSVILNQLFLADQRQWFTTIEPSVFAGSEFIYGGQTRMDPVVIGPRPQEGLPRGMVLRNTFATGPHPYRGGPFTLTVVLSRLPVGNIARQFLDVVEATSKALAPTLGIEAYAKIGSVVLSGFDKLMGLDGVKPLIGFRETYNPDAGQAFRPGFWALVDADAPDPARLFVADGMLLEGPDRARATPFRDADFLLYQFARAPDGRRQDIDRLPLQAQWQAALRAATVATEGAWADAKTTYLEMMKAAVTSPDLTDDQAAELSDSRWRQLKALHDQALSVATAGPKPVANARAPLQRRILEILDTP